MVLQALAFYLFAAVTVASGVMVITARNPVHSVLFLILAFFNSAGLFVLLGAEFLAMILVVVYVGAVAVLFLFVVMMLDINFVQLREGFQRYLPVGALIGLVLAAELVLSPPLPSAPTRAPPPRPPFRGGRWGGCAPRGSTPWTWRRRSGRRRTAPRTTRTGRWRSSGGARSRCRRGS